MKRAEKDFLFARHKGRKRGEFDTTKLI